MPIVTENRLKGNYGAAVVMARLSGECLVRPVTSDTDVGVDLYCETVTQGQPFLHFWVQVKAGDQCKADVVKKNASCSFETDHLIYWSRQPVPVFAALVPTTWPVLDDPDIYIVDITTSILFSGIPSMKDSVTLHSDYHWPAGNADSVRAFIKQVVPDITARLQCSRGVVATSPTIIPEYVRRIPVVPVIKYRDVILGQIRTTAVHSILFSVASSEDTADIIGFRHLLANIVEQFSEDPHWENYMARALSSHIDKDYETALVLYTRAKKSIMDDPSVRDLPPWKEKVHHIEQLERLANNRQPFNSSG